MQAEFLEGYPAVLARVKKAEWPFSIPKFLTGWSETATGSWFLTFVRKGPGQSPATFWEIAVHSLLPVALH